MLCGDVSPTIVYNANEPQRPVPPGRLWAPDAAAGDFSRDNPHSGAVWHYEGENPREFARAMHRTRGTVGTPADLRLVADFSGLLHCLSSPWPNNGSGWRRSTWGAPCT